MDALTHAIEGYITKGAWKLTDMMHLKAIEIISHAGGYHCPLQVHDVSVSLQENLNL